MGSSGHQPARAVAARLMTALSGVIGGVLLAELLVRIGAVLVALGVGAGIAWLRLGQAGRARAASPARRRVVWVPRLTVLLVGVVGVVVSEQGIHCVGRPEPKVQIVRGRDVHALGGVPVWEESAGRQHRACAEEHPERLRILFFGSSITYGSGLSTAETFTTELERRLNETWPLPGVCVLSFAQPGFSFAQKYAVAEVEVARYRPALILWEDWTEWVVDYHLLGGAAFALQDFALTADGFPWIEGVPTGVNRFLFLHSRLYQYTALIRGQRLERPDERAEVAAFIADRLSRVPDLAASVGARLALYLAPPLDQPFSTLSASPPEWHRSILEFARRRDIPAFLLQRELAGEDYQQVRLDPCCHYNARGHRLLVPIFEHIVSALLADRLRRPIE
jgi:hypothetical protein